MGLLPLVALAAGLALLVLVLTRRDPTLTDECHEGDCEDCPGIEVAGDVIECCECECHEVERPEPEAEELGVPA